MCFDTCTTQFNKDSPISTQFSTLIISNFLKILGEFHPREAVDPALDYTVELREGKPIGMWVCALCYLTDVDVSVITLHIKHKHSPDAMIKCRRCDAAFMRITALDDHYCSKHHEHISVNSQFLAHFCLIQKAWKNT